MTYKFICEIEVEADSEDEAWAEMADNLFYLTSDVFKLDQMMGTKQSEQFLIRRYK